MATGWEVPSERHDEGWLAVPMPDVFLSSFSIQNPVAKIQMLGLEYDQGASARARDGFAELFTLASRRVTLYGLAFSSQPDGNRK